MWLVAAPFGGGVRDEGGSWPHVGGMNGEGVGLALYRGTHRAIHAGDLGTTESSPPERVILTLSLAAGDRVGAQRLGHPREGITQCGVYRKAPARQGG